MTFGERLEWLMLAHRLKAKDVAARTGLKLSFVVQQQNQRFPGKPDTVRVMAAAFGLDTATFLMGVETKQQASDRLKAALTSPDTASNTSSTSVVTSRREGANDAASIAASSRLQQPGQALADLVRQRGSHHAEPPAKNGQSRPPNDTQGAGGQHRKIPKTHGTTASRSRRRG
jgi:transcriptional regulator with XRE-family HTH domain